MTNYAKLIPDFGLTADQLDDKYNPDGDGEHPEITRRFWATAVSQGKTLVGYWDWVEYRLELAENDLADDNPYNRTGDAK